MNDRMLRRRRVVGLVLLAPLLAMLAMPALSPTATAQGADRDADGLYDDDETDYYGTDPDQFDSDGDGSGDGEEVYYGTDPLSADGSGGGEYDEGDDADSGPRGDGDGDGLFDDDETDVYGTDPYAFDSDGDGVGDGEEVYYGTDPLGGGNGAPNPGEPDPGAPDPGMPDPGNPDPGAPNPGGGNPGGGVDANCLDAEEQAVLTLINQLRAARGAAPVRVSGTLAAAAEAHSQDMGGRQFTAHTNPDGVNEQQRIFAHGWQPGNPWQVAENIAWGSESGATTYAGWEASAGHFANMTDPNLVAIGIARVNVPGSPHGWYWTTTHANRFDVAPVC